jgi:hypothetical protein
MILVLTLEKSNLLVDSLGQRMSIEVTLVAFQVEDNEIHAGKQIVSTGVDHWENSLYSP